MKSDAKLKQGYSVIVNHDVVALTVLNREEHAEDMIRMNQLAVDEMEEALRNEGNKQFDLLIDLSRFQGAKYGRKLREMHSNLLKNPQILKVAVVSEGVIMESFVKMMTYLTGREEKIQLFTDKNEAWNWLRRDNVKKINDSEQAGVLTSIDFQDRLSRITPILQQVALGDFDHILDVPDREDGLTEHLVALNLMIDDLRTLQNDNENKELELEKNIKLLSKQKNDITVERDKTNTILQSIGDAVFVIDLSYRITVFSDAAKAITGYSDMEVKNKSYDEILNFRSEEDKKKTDQFIKDVFKFGEQREIAENSTIKTKLGKEVPVTSSASPLMDTDGRTVGAVIVFHDVSRQRELEKLKDDFMNIAAHDLRTPVTAVKGYVSLIRQGQFGEVPQGELGEALRFVEDASDRMISLVGDFLTVSKMQQGRMLVKLEDVDIGKTVADLISTIKVTIEDRPIELVLELEEKLPHVLVDVGKLDQVLTNLIDNSLKHTEEGEVRIKVNLIEADQVRIDVSDTGSGIHSEDLPKIFQQYYKGKKTSEVASGRGGSLGLGLYIVKEIVNQHHGRIWVDSEYGVGTAFHFTLLVANEKNRKKVEKENKKKEKLKTS